MTSSVRHGRGVRFDGGFLARTGVVSAAALPGGAALAILAES